MLKGRKRGRGGGWKGLYGKYHPPSSSSSLSLFPISLPPSLSHSPSLCVNAEAKSFYHHFQSLSRLLSAPVQLSEPGRRNFASPSLSSAVLSCPQPPGQVRSAPGSVSRTEREDGGVSKITIIVSFELYSSGRVKNKKLDLDFKRRVHS